MPRRYERRCDQCGKDYKGLGAKFCSPACSDLSKIKPSFSPPPPLDPDWPLSIKPVEVHVPVYKLPKPLYKNLYTSLHYGDVHFPFQDDRVLNILYAIVREVQPNLVVDHGDLADCYQISRFEKNPHHRVSMQQEIELAAKHLATLAGLAPNAERWYLKGNHEDRLRRIVWDMAQGAPGQLMTLPGVTEALRWENLLGLEKMGWVFYEKRVTLFDKIILKHGDVVRKQSAYSARAEHEKYAKSGMSGHTHRAGDYYQRDHNGQHGWFEIGCCCNIDPEYVDDPNWQNSFLVVTWSDDRTQYRVERVLIHDGMAMFRGKLYGTA